MAVVPKQVKIEKKEYHLDIKKRFQNVHSYKARPRTFRESISDIFKRKESKPQLKHDAKPEKPGGFNVAIIAAGVVIAVLLVLFVWVYLSLQSYTETPVLPSFSRPAISNTVLDGDVITAGDRYSDSYAAEAYVKYSAEENISYSVSISTYDKKIPSEVFILKSDRNGADSYSRFLVSLRSRFAEKGMTVNEITINELEDMPSGAVVIVPSGYIPKELIGGSSSITPDSLAAKGAVIVYIGRPFSKALDNGVVIDIPLSLQKNVPFTFDDHTRLTASGLSIYQPLYSVSSSGSGWAGTLAYGAISIITKGNGAFIFVPQTLDGGWRTDPLKPEKGADEYAADDISELIMNISWAQPDGLPKLYSFDSDSDTVYLYSMPFKGDSRTIVLDFTGTKRIDRYTNITSEERELLYVTKKANGDLFIPSGYSVVSTSISNQNVRMYGVMAENPATQSDAYLIVKDDHDSEVLRIPQRRVDTGGEITMDVPLNLPKGEYTAELINDIGKIYAAAYLMVNNVDIKYRGESRAVYKFAFLMNGNPVDPPLKRVVVSVDNGKYGTYEFTDASSISVDVSSKTGGDSLPMGDHVFSFEIGSVKEDVKVKKAQSVPPIFADPVFLGAIIFSVLIVGAGVVFARKEDVSFYVDIPDFPLTAREKIPISSDVVLSIFERVNSNYKWKYVPLKIDEVRSGFRDILYKGKSIYITDYNAEFLLDKMKSEGKIKEALGYYAPSYWETKSGKGIVYLALMRGLRDICIDNATPFSAFGESKKSDREIDVMGQKMFVHFYDESSDEGSLFRHALETVPDGITIVLFKDEFSKDRFRTLLDSPSQAQMLFKLEVESSSILLLTLPELESMIKELKAV